MNDKIIRLVAYLIKTYKTNDPEQIAEYLGVTVIRMPLDDMAGFYKCIKRRKYIFLNSDIEDDSFTKIVLSHELGHSIMHPRENCAFMNKHTLLLTSKIERQANIFTAYFLITNKLLDEYKDFTREQFCNCTGYPEELLELRLK
ncbi:ImmA/IrrE family metallo-endopeptidase [Lacrimispora sp.]|uniref:ImmA/IrrE family metallo-endopeptidase n=1 Tax=Lacrimispora sp. TaxID=2719234 RepID=UPI0034617487